MTPGVGLNTWKNIGSFNREIRPYVEYVRNGWKVKILTFDRNNIPQLPEGIEAVRFPHRYLLWLLPLYKKLGTWADIIKTNQSVKAYFYTTSASYWKKPILLRCGYVHGEYLVTTRGLTPRIRLYQKLEAIAFQQATHCQIPTKELSEWVQKKYKIQKSKISVIPNFVDADIFKPSEEIKPKEKSVISVGRLASVKRFDMLVKAYAEIPECSLTIVGEGPERQNLQNLAKKLNVSLSLPGNMPNEELPKILCEHQIFGITSIREGHPKALIEAMACGMTCIGVRSVGIENIIRHGINGWLVEAEIDSLKKGLRRLFFDRELCNEISSHARQFVVENFGFNKLMSNEIKTIAESLLSD